MNVKCVTITSFIVFLAEAVGRQLKVVGILGRQFYGSHRWAWVTCETSQVLLASGGVFFSGPTLRFTQLTLSEIILMGCKTLIK